MAQPQYFYDIHGITDEGKARWEDEYACVKGVVIPGKTDEPRWRAERGVRNMIYDWWQSRFPFRHRQNIFQAIRIIKHEWEEPISGWWDAYQDCVFRVFVEPHTQYDEATGEHIQFYILCPEDAYLVNRNEIQKQGAQVPTREYHGDEKWISKHPPLRSARIVPTKACHHYRHETTGGVLPSGL